MDVAQTCKNCHQIFQGSYCNFCGQKVAHRLTTPHVFHELLHVFTHADKGILSLIPTILFRPGKFALDYVEGKRKRYFSIFQYLILLVGVVTFLMAKSHYLENLTQSLNAGSPGSLRVQTVQKQMMGGLQQYMNLVLFALLPVFSLFSWLVFRSKKYNYAEHFVLQAAVQAQINTFILIFIIPLAFLLQKEQQKILLPITIVLFVVCTTTAIRQFFNVSWLQAFLKGLVVYILTNIIQLILTIVATVLLVMKYKG
ncbi:MAG TPA: DUF3667 domain-containing protein [Flavisolibacter sp.]|jgi:hypothetical protein